MWNDGRARAPVMCRTGEESSMAVTIKELLNGLGKWSPEVITSRREELCGYRLLHSGEKPDKPDCL